MISCDLNNNNNINSNNKKTDALSTHQILYRHTKTYGTSINELPCRKFVHTQIRGKLRQKINNKQTNKKNLNSFCVR